MGLGEHQDRHAASVRLFGPLELELGATRLGPGDLGGVKPKQLLEVLLLERGRSVTKDRLADALWGERLPQNVAPTLESYVSVLRRRLGLDVGRRLIVTERGGYRLAADALDVDVERFGSLLRRAAAAGAAMERRAALEAALGLVVGELLADEPYAEWVLPEREHQRALQVQAWIDLAECCLELGDHQAALAAVDETLRIEPTSERAYRVAMRAHVALGNRAEALRTHVRCREALADALGVSPSPETAELHVAILRDEQPTVGLVHAALPIGYADNGAGVRIAYQVVGDGPIDLVFNPSFVTNLGATWDDPTYASFLRRLASMSRLILFDKRGTGLSDPALDFPTTRERSDDLVGVLDAVGSERAVLFGVCAGGALCIQFAADHPDRTAALILHNSFARMLGAIDYPCGWPREHYERVLEGFEQAWLRQDGIVRRNPGLADNPGYRDWFARYVRLAANPWMARRLAELNAGIDVRGLLEDVRAPCLVITRTEDTWFAPDASRHLAQRIPRAELVELPGVDHDPWVGDSEAVLAAINEFLASVSRDTPAAARVRG